LGIRERKREAMSWPVTLIADPLDLKGHKDSCGYIIWSGITLTRVPMQDILNNESVSMIEDRDLQFAFADFISRTLTKTLAADFCEQFEDDSCSQYFAFETLDQYTATSSRRRRQRATANITPLVLERTDMYCHKDQLYLYLRVLAIDKVLIATKQLIVTPDVIQRVTNKRLSRAFSNFSISSLLNHVATVALQVRLRQQLAEFNAVAFCANGAILPRKSGASHLPMAGAVPFVAPVSMTHTIHVEMGQWKQYLLAPVQTTNNTADDDAGDSLNSARTATTSVQVTGLIIPRGITLIVGGGYHGKSTLLRTVAAGIYNKVPGDGRELCVTTHDAVTIRAEDGRFLSNCNLSAFIANLPQGMNSSSIDTTTFSTGEASGSTSQAASVVEAMEMGASAFLVDEDVSAANFMARDGRMRSLVMDESITPFLYRVNGLYKTHGISSLVVVGGVGDWLDVPNHVILMDNYECKDATAKARSVSKQFSYGHVEYAGRGVVHRLDWLETGTPSPRRPTDVSAGQFERKVTAVSLLEGSDAILIYPTESLDNAILPRLDDDEEQYIEMSRCEQLMGKKPQLYGCGLCTLWLLEAACMYPTLGIAKLLEKLDEDLDEYGMLQVATFGPTKESDRLAHESPTWQLLVETLGYATRPRVFEVGQALTRLRAIEMEKIKVKGDSDVAAVTEADRKKQELLDMWAKRRVKNAYR
jgi:hypothetical protein